MLTRVAQDAERALATVEQAEGLMDDEHVKAAHQLLRELIGQDFDIDPDGVLRLHRGTRSDRIISTIDTEMRHGRKSSQTRFDGYKLSASATNSSEPLITAVHVSSAGETDGPPTGWWKCLTPMLWKRMASCGVVSAGARRVPLTPRARVGAVGAPRGTP